ncbi:hypothetical protein GQ54DRAFT_265971 [Martensiomyces pterosporus]|nr:hypothetical protein GQ54DRAFT_265971 [Martensiomyces pterosporus]
MVKLKQDRIISEDLRAMLARRRAVFAQQLVEIFPIEMVSGELAEDERLRWSICGLRIRNPDKANEETAAALGLVVRLLDAISRYNNIALRFPVVPLGSRSVVCNPVAKAEWPLFMLKASDRPRLHTGIRLLETNVEQLLCQLGVQDVDRKQMLPNLVQLLMTIEGCSFAR